MKYNRKHSIHITYIKRINNYLYHIDTSCTPKSLQVVVKFDSSCFTYINEFCLQNVLKSKERSDNIVLFQDLKTLRNAFIDFHAPVRTVTLYKYIIFLFSSNISSFCNSLNFSVFIHSKCFDFNTKFNTVCITNSKEFKLQIRIIFVKPLSRVTRLSYLIQVPNYYHHMIQEISKPVFVMLKRGTFM